jgi:hypothetical protein
MLTDNRKIETTRGVRNNNPMNLRKGVAFQYQVENPNEKSFMTFGKTWQGIRAGVLDLTNDIAKGKNTITSLISQFAPPSENNTAAYINNVAKATGLKPDEVIDRKNFVLMCKLVNSIIAVENGANALKFVTSQDITEGVKSAFTYRGYKLTDTPKTETPAPKNPNTELITLFIGVVVVIFVLKLLIK